LPSRSLPWSAAPCGGALTTVSYSHLTSEQLLDTADRDDRFVVRQVL
jgi:hypothetical protein